MGFSFFPLRSSFVCWVLLAPSPHSAPPATGWEEPAIGTMQPTGIAGMCPAHPMMFLITADGTYTVTLDVDATVNSLTLGR